MEFQMIPEDRRVFLDPKRLKAYGDYYIIGKKYCFEAALNGYSWFRLRRLSEATEFTFGNTFLTRRYTIKIPEDMVHFKTFCVSYEKDYVDLILGGKIENYTLE